MSKRDEFAKTVADQLIKLLEETRAPWQKPWEAGHGPAGFHGMPFNALSGRIYTGGNVIHLMGTALAKGYEDNRWLTFNQIQKAGLFVRKGERHTKIEYWDFSKVRKGKDAVEGEGEDQTRRGPSHYLFQVFNGSQIEGMPEPVRRVERDVEWRHNECERLLAESQARIAFDGGDRAFYRPRSDSIHLPVKSAFKSADGFYATALHELGHWTGHPLRLDRDQSGVFGTESYAREELVAEISSMLMGDRVGIGHDPGQHAAYVGHWIKLLREDPKEILRAASQAEAVCKHLGIEAYQHEPMQVKERTKDQEQTQEPKARRSRVKQQVRKQEHALSL